MARSAYIYHLYKDGQRLISATVKHEILHYIKNNNCYNQSLFRLTVSGDCSVGETEVLGWRNIPVKGEPIINADNKVVGHVDKVLDGPTPNGNYLVTNRENIKITINYDKTKDEVCRTPEGVQFLNRTQIWKWVTIKRYSKCEKIVRN